MGWEALVQRDREREMKIGDRVVLTKEKVHGGKSLIPGLTGTIAEMENDGALLVLVSFNNGPKIWVMGSYLEKMK